MIFHKLGTKFWWHEDPDTNVCLRVVADDHYKSCLYCYFLYHCPKDTDYEMKLEECSALSRPDNINVHFEEEA